MGGRGRLGRPLRLGACALLATMAAACASPQPRTTVVLLSDPDGATGVVDVSNEGGAATLDEAGEATTVTAPSAAPSKPFLLEEAEIRERFGPALEARPLEPVTFTLYFEKDSEELTEESLALLPRIVETIAGRSSFDTSVVGHTDRVGPARYNYELSKKRAEGISRMLVERGVDPAILDITSHGEENPLVPTADEVAEPRNRRVEVTVR